MNTQCCKTALAITHRLTVCEDMGGKVLTQAHVPLDLDQPIKTTATLRRWDVDCVVHIPTDLSARQFSYELRRGIRIMRKLPRAQWAAEAMAAVRNR